MTNEEAVKVWQARLRECQGKIEELNQHLQHWVEARREAMDALDILDQEQEKQR